MEKSFKLKKHMNLTFPEQLIYALLSCCSDTTFTSHATREGLAEKSGVKKLDTITKYTNTLQEKGLIRKEHITRDGKKLAIYHILNPQDDFIGISNDILQVKTGLAGFLIKLAELRGEGTDTVRMSYNEIIRTLEMSKSTFYRYKAELISMGLIKETDEGLEIDTHLFPALRHLPQEIKDFKKELDDGANEDESFKKTRLYTVFMKHYKDNFKDVRMPLDKLPMALKSGIFFIREKPYKEDYPKTFNF